MRLKSKMSKKVIIVHGWGGNPKEGWFPWLKRKLEDCGAEVRVLPMPNPETPKIGEWAPFIYEQIGEPDENTFFIGHSIGCQTIMRYLEKVKSKAGGAIFVAGWFDLKGIDEEEKPIAKPWIEEPIDLERVKQNAGKIVAFFSDNDPYVDYEYNSQKFRDELGAEIIEEFGKKHFSGEDGIKEISRLLEEAMEMVGVSPIGSRAVEESADYKF